MLQLPLIGLLLFLVYWGTRQIRYGSGREVILNLFCFIQGRKTKWVVDPSLARRLLQASTSKGIGIEQLLSTQAFRPIISLESINDEQWSRMKDNFTLLKPHFPSLDSLAKIAEDLSTSYLKEQPLIDSPTLSKLIVEIITTWLFGQQEEDVSLQLIAAIDEWRKEIAIKGKGDANLKLYAVNWIQDKIRKNTQYYDIFQEKWFTDEYWSLLLQPLIVSPAINITDLAVTLSSAEFKKEFKMEAIPFNTEKADMERIILSGINYNHPFPVLERWFPEGLKEEGGEFIIEPNTHIFIPIDKIGRMSCTSNSKQSSWTAFGGGRRACGGKDIALTTCINMFYPLLTHPQSQAKFKPWINHNYSGRDNDEKETWSQTCFQIQLLIKIVSKLVLKRLGSVNCKFVMIFGTGLLLIWFGYHNLVKE